jgi:uracil-DNA glycosylase
LRAELEQSPNARVILALGAIAHVAVLRAYDLPLAKFRFAHGARHDLGEGRLLLDSYHCSRYNTQTRRLTTEMFEAVIEQACELAKCGSS